MPLLTLQAYTYNDTIFRQILSGETVPIKLYAVLPMFIDIFFI
jgi:hypothetical protein